jgi:beta-lactamase class A
MKNLRNYLRNNKKVIIGHVGIFILGIFSMYTFIQVQPSFDGPLSSFLNPSLSIFKKENMIVDFQDLRKSLQNKFEGENKKYLTSIYFEYLPTGANIAVNKDTEIWPASLIKIPVAMAALKKVQDKKWKIDNELVIFDEDKDSEYGGMYKEPTGTTYSIETFLEKSLVDSDNTAHFVLLRNLDGEELEDVYIHLGMDDVISALKRSKGDEDIDNRITAKRYTVFFRSLYNASYLNQEYSELFLNVLSRAPRDLLSKGLPEDVMFVHKTGIRIDEFVRADSGIVYAKNRPYLLTVMVQAKSKEDFDEDMMVKIFESISNEVYTYVTEAR